MGLTLGVCDVGSEKEHDGGKKILSSKGTGASLQWIEVVFQISGLVWLADVL